MRTEQALHEFIASRIAANLSPAYEPASSLPVVTLVSICEVFRGRHSLVIQSKSS